MDNYREDNYRVRSYDVDIQRRLRISGMLDFFQESAWRHAEDLNVGVEGLGSQGCFWVLSRLSLEVHRYPVWNEEITVRTWPKGIDKLMALRDFLLFDDAGEVCARASTAWIIIDGKKRRPVRVEPFFSHVHLVKGQDALPGTAEKISPLSGEMEAGRYTAGYSVLDMNRHVNNARYADWIADSFPLDRFTGSAIREFSINYLAEIGPGEEVGISIALGDKDVFFVSGTSGERVNFRSRVAWSSSIE